MANRIQENSGDHLGKQSALLGIAASFTVRDDGGVLLDGTRLTQSVEELGDTSVDGSSATPFKRLSERMLKDDDFKRDLLDGKHTKQLAEWLASLTFKLQVTDKAFPYGDVADFVDIIEGYIMDISLYQDDLNEETGSDLDFEQLYSRQLVYLNKAYETHQSDVDSMKRFPRLSKIVRYIIEGYQLSLENAAAFHGKGPSTKK